jgi:hypothetical protein
VTFPLSSSPLCLHPSSRLSSSSPLSSSPPLPPSQFPPPSIPAEPQLPAERGAGPSLLGRVLFQVFFMFFKGYSCPDLCTYACLPQEGQPWWESTTTFCSYAGTNKVRNYFTAHAACQVHRSPCTAGSLGTHAAHTHGSDGTRRAHRMPSLRWRPPARVPARTSCALRCSYPRQPNRTRASRSFPRNRAKRHFLLFRLYTTFSVQGLGFRV